MNDRTVSALWIVGPHEAELRPETLAAPRPGEVLVRTLYSGISRGTETLVFAGRVPDSQYQAMRAPFQAGTFPAPVKYGYQNVGVVEDGPADLVGRAVFCLFPHQSAYVVPADAVIPLPPDIPASRAVLAANMETAVNALWDAPPHIGDRITVIGAGVVGCLVAYLAARTPAARVELVDIDPGKRRIAEHLGVPFASPQTAEPEADLIYHASGSPAGLPSALSIAAFEATIVELSWFGDTPVTIPLGEDFHARRLVLKSSQVGSVAASRRMRRSHRHRLSIALSLLGDERLDALISGEDPLSALPDVMGRLANRPAGVLCHRIRYSD